MAKLKRYRIYCDTEATYVYWWLDDGAAAPTTCSNDSGHTVSGTATVVATSEQDAQQSAGGILYTIPHPQQLAHEMCDRDIKLVCCTMDASASLTVSGADSDGDVLYTGAFSGTGPNSFSVEHIDSASGGLAVAVTAKKITVDFGGDSPTGTQVKDAVNADAAAANLVVASTPGTGASASSTAVEANLAGGTGASVEDLKVDLDTNLEKGWDECALLGVFKADGNACTDQTDANANGVLSVWDYCARNPSTAAKIAYDIRDGYLITDTIPGGEKWDHRTYAVAAPLIPESSGGRVKLFDGYLGPAPNGVIDAKSPQAKQLDPALGPSTSCLRLYIYHPAGSKLNHVLRLVTYRPNGTF